MNKKGEYSLLSNSRFYILVSTFILSIAVFSFLRLQIPSDQLFFIRTQQVYGLLCIIYLYIALIISPISHIIGKDRLRYAIFARRAIGVSAFYFGLLHSIVTVCFQLGGIDQLHNLPTVFKWSLACGAIALVILLIMALTSFDVIVRFMTPSRWKWLHRLVYFCVILIMAHVWLIGTHLAYSGIQIAAFMALITLVGLELFVTIQRLNYRYIKLGKIELFTLFISGWIIVSVFIFFIPAYVSNYHARHTDHKYMESKK